MRVTTEMTTGVTTKMRESLVSLLLEISPSIALPIHTHAQVFTIKINSRISSSNKKNKDESQND